MFADGNLFRLLALILALAGGGSLRLRRTVVRGHWRRCWEDAPEGARHRRHPKLRRNSSNAFSRRDRGPYSLCLLSSRPALRGLACWVAAVGCVPRCFLGPPGSPCQRGRQTVSSRPSTSGTTPSGPSGGTSPRTDNSARSSWTASRTRAMWLCPTPSVSVTYCSAVHRGLRRARCATSGGTAAEQPRAGRAAADRASGGGARQHARRDAVRRWRVVDVDREGDGRTERRRDSGRRLEHAEVLLDGQDAGTRRRRSGHDHALFHATHGTRDDVILAGYSWAPTCFLPRQSIAGCRTAARAVDGADGAGAGDRFRISSERLVAAHSEGRAADRTRSVGMPDGVRVTCVYGSRRGGTFAVHTARCGQCDADAERTAGRASLRRRLRGARATRFDSAARSARGSIPDVGSAQWHDA